MGNYKLLTTGEMIDQLKVGEIAQDKNGEIVRRGNEGIETSEGKFINCNYLFLSQKWHILPKYVSFEEAMQALKEGKRVSFTFLNEDDFEETIYIKNYFGAKSSLRQEIEWRDLFKPNWVIEED